MSDKRKSTNNHNTLRNLIFQSPSHNQSIMYKAVLVAVLVACAAMSSEASFLPVLGYGGIGGGIGYGYGGIGGGVGYGYGGIGLPSLGYGYGLGGGIYGGLNLGYLGGIGNFAYGKFNNYY